MGASGAARADRASRVVTNSNFFLTKGLVFSRCRLVDDNGARRAVINARLGQYLGRAFTLPVVMLAMARFSLLSRRPIRHRSWRVGSECRRCLTVSREDRRAVP